MRCLLNLNFNVLCIVSVSVPVYWPRASMVEDRRQIGIPAAGLKQMGYEPHSVDARN